MNLNTDKLEQEIIEIEKQVTRNIAKWPLGKLTGNVEEFDKSLTNPNARICYCFCKGSANPEITKAINSLVKGSPTQPID